MRTAPIVAVVAVLTLVTLSCSFFGYTDEPLEVVIHGSSFTLHWDPPAGTGSSSLLQLLSYELFYRPYPASFGSGWESLATVGGDDSLRFAVSSDHLDPGRYEFAVRAVFSDGSESDYHRSTESTADPPTGWYLNWLGG